jgi:hypothetical protein
MYGRQVIFQKTPISILICYHLSLVENGTDRQLIRGSSEQFKNQYMEVLFFRPMKFSLFEITYKTIGPKLNATGCNEVVKVSQ